jgi:hypothetical protein
MSRAKYDRMKQKKNDEIDEKDKEMNRLRNTNYGFRELIMILKGIIIVLIILAFFYKINKSPGVNVAPPISF